MRAPASRQRLRRAGRSAGVRSSLNRLLQVGRREDWVVRMQPRRGGAFDASITAAVVRDWDGTRRGAWLIREVVGPAWRAAGHARVTPAAGGRVTIGRASKIQPDALESERLRRLRGDRGRGPARAAARHRPDRLGGRRRDRPVLVRQPPRRAAAGLSRRELARRAGVLGRDHPRPRIDRWPRRHRARCVREAGPARWSTGS